MSSNGCAPGGAFEGGGRLDEKAVREDGQTLLTRMSIRGEVVADIAACLMAASVVPFDTELVLVKMLFVSFSIV